MKGHCGHDESELQVFWVDRAYTLKMLFLKVTASEAGGAPADSGCGWIGAAPLPPRPSLRRRFTRTSSARQESHNTPKGPEATWKLSKVQFVYDSSEKTHFKDAVSGEWRSAGLERDPGAKQTLLGSQVWMRNSLGFWKRPRLALGDGGRERV